MSCVAFSKSPRPSGLTFPICKMEKRTPSPRRAGGDANGRTQQVSSSATSRYRCVPTSGHWKTEGQLGNEAGAGVSGRGGRKGQRAWTRRRPARRCARDDGAGRGALGAGPVESLQRADGRLLRAGGLGAGQRPGPWRRVAASGRWERGSAGRRPPSSVPRPSVQCILTSPQGRRSGQFRWRTRIASEIPTVFPHLRHRCVYMTSPQSSLLLKSCKELVHCVTLKGT